MQNKTTNRYKIIFPSDYSEATRTGFLKEIGTLLLEKPKLISLDCSSLKNIVSSQIGLLWEMRRRCRKAGTGVELLSPSSGLICVLKVLDLYDQFQYVDEATFKPREKTAKVIPTKNYADEFTPDAESIDKAQSGFVRFLESLNLHHMTIFELQTIFYEVATNFRLHSGMQLSEFVVFTARTNDKKIALAFTDSGKLFDITKYPIDLNPEIAGKNKKRRGFGIVLIHRLADKIEYIGGKFGLNILVLEKRWK